jgi:hypothetical protein
MQTALLQLKKNAFINNKKKILSEYYDNEILRDVNQNLKDKINKKTNKNYETELYANIKNINVIISFEVHTYNLINDKLNCKIKFEDLKVICRIKFDENEYKHLHFTNIQSGFLFGNTDLRHKYEIKKTYLKHMLKFYYYDKFNLLYIDKLNCKIKFNDDPKHILLKKLGINKTIPENSGECCVCFDMCGSHYHYDEIPHYMCINCYINYNKKNICPICKKDHDDY